MFNFGLKRAAISPNVPWMWFFYFLDGAKACFVDGKLSSTMGPNQRTWKKALPENGLPFKLR